VSELPEIAEVHRLEIRPGDRIVVHVDRTELSQVEAADIQLRVQAALHTLTPVLVLPKEWELGVIGPETEEQK
jgi:hypothetical protein